MSGNEIEAKFYVHDLGKIELRLRELKAQLIQPRIHETNLRFDNASNDLRNTFRVLRLRHDEKARLTYKGPGEEQGKGILSRREIEFIVEDFERAREFLEALGYRIVAFYEKFRATYKLNDTHVMLDELPYGQFIEIEGENQAAIYAVSDLLGLNQDVMVKASYLALFERVAQKHNLEPSQLSFAALANVNVTTEDLEVQTAD